MTALLILASLYLLAALALILVIDRSVGILFPVSGHKTGPAIRPPQPDIAKQSPLSH